MAPSTSSSATSRSSRWPWSSTPSLGVTRDDGDLALMVKPQFEVGKDRVGKGGVVRDPELRAEAVLGVCAAARARGWAVRGVATSPLPGPSGNVEFFVWLRRSGAGLEDPRSPRRSAPSTPGWPRAVRPG